jgi:hypothetical protein
MLPIVLCTIRNRFSLHVCSHEWNRINIASTSLDLHKLIASLLMFANDWKQHDRNIFVRLVQCFRWISSRTELDMIDDWILSSRITNSCIRYIDRTFRTRTCRCQIEFQRIDSLQFSFGWMRTIAKKMTLSPLIYNWEHVSRRHRLRLFCDVFSSIV